MAIYRRTVNYSSIADPGSVCTNPTITYIAPSNITIPCENSDSFDIEINTNVAGPYCITFVIDCSDSCSSCGQIEVTKCFCVDSDDCGECETCTDSLCVSTCAEGKVCDDDTCVDCTSDEDCLCDQQCIQGSCKCPGSLKKRADGCCVECFDGDDLGNCLVCISGEIVGVDCPDGYCNQDTGDCQECLNNSHCTDPNECCNAQGTCSCCPGFILDPETGECIEAPPCNNAQDCIDQFGPCYYCTEDGCAPIICPNGWICNPDTGDCVPPCGNCPEGSGCINGMCIPCSELSCGGEGLQCQFATGCECVGLTCEYIDCDVTNTQMVWDVTEAEQGTVVNPGQPSLQGTTNITPLGIVYLQPPTGAGYMNHQFNLSITNGTNGTWTLYNTPTNSVSLGTGTSKSFDLTNTGTPPNLVIFIVKFVETGTGRTATWAFQRAPVALTEPNVWSYQFQSTGTPPTTTGGSPGSVQLCSTNANFIPVGVTNVQTTGTIVITLIPTGGNCMIASISGCGRWKADIIVECGGTQFTVPAEEFFRDPANCCDPTDPNCDGWGTGDPCQDITVQNIDIVAIPTYGSAPSGDGEFMFVADAASAGISLFDLFYIDPSDACWSTANNPASASNDIQIVTNASQSPFGPSISNLSVFATLGDGGCIRLGHTCELLIGGCKKLQGEKCLTECQAFSVDIIDLGSNTYKAVPSLQDEPVTYVWTYPGLVINTNQTVTITPVGGASTLSVTAKYGSPVKCTATDVLTLSTTIPGCTNSAACNYNSAANQDDNSCVLVGDPSYVCVLGGFIPGTLTGLADTMPSVVWKISGVALTPNQQLNPGTYTVDLFFNGIQKCSRTLVVPQCYRCSSGVCVAAPLGDNTGFYEESTCGNRCSCDIEVNVTQVCSNNQSALVITAQGDTGSYTVTVDKVGGTQVLPPTAMTDSGSVTTPLVCNGVYRIVVQGVNCNTSVDYSATCFDCDGSTVGLSGISYECASNQLFFTIISDPCAALYTVRLLDSSLNQIVSTSYTNPGAKTVALGTYPGDGGYTVRVFDSFGCARDYDLVLNCNNTLEDCSITGASLNFTDTGVNVSFTATFTLDEAGGSYTVTLHTTTEGNPLNCNGSVVSLPIGSPVNVVGVLGTNTVNFPNAISTPGSAECYAVVIQKNGTGNETCNETAYVAFQNNTEAPPQCSLEITNVSYDTATGRPIVSWTGANTSNDITLQFQVAGGPVCAGGDPVVLSVDGNGETGTNIPFGPIHQLQGIDQCVTLTIYDTGEPTCEDTFEFTIPGCTCGMEIDDVEIDATDETATVTYTTTCTSGTITIDWAGAVSTGSGSDNTASENGVAVQNTTVIALVDYPSTGENGTMEIVDDADAGCSDTLNVSLPANCTNCSKAAGLIASTLVSEIVIEGVHVFGGGNILTGTFTMPTDDAAFEAQLETDLADEGANFCAGATPVDFGETVNRMGFLVEQDSDTNIDLNYVEVSAAEFVGTLKAYFTDCGCDTQRFCDYTLVVSNSEASVIYIGFGDDNISNFHSDSTSFNLPSSPTPTDLANIRTHIEATIADQSCSQGSPTVGVTYNAGADETTFVISGTNLGPTVVQQTYGSATPTAYHEFTQSGC